MLRLHCLLMRRLIRIIGGNKFKCILTEDSPVKLGEWYRDYSSCAIGFHVNKAV